MRPPNPPDVLRMMIAPDGHANVLGGSLSSASRLHSPANSIYNCRGPCRRSAPSGMRCAGLTDGASDERIDSGLRLRDENSSSGGNPGPRWAMPQLRWRAASSGFPARGRADSIPRIRTTRARAAGYGLNPNKERVVRKKKGRSKPSDITPPRAGFVERKSALPMAGGILPALDKPETSGFASILYPLRSADSLAVIASLTVILWLFTILVPEYCIG